MEIILVGLILGPLAGFIIGFLVGHNRGYKMGRDRVVKVLRVPKDAKITCVAFSKK